MPLVKLIKINEGYNSRSLQNDYYDEQVIGPETASMSDWEEITDEELEYLRSPESFRILNSNKFYYTVAVLEDRTNTGEIQGFVKSIKDLVEKNKKAMSDREQKHKEAEKKRKATLEAKKIEAAKKVLLKAGLINE